MRKKYIPIVSKTIHSRSHDGKAVSKIKSKKSRQLINRFHVLLKAKTLLFTRIKASPARTAVTEDLYIQTLKLEFPKIFQRYENTKLQTLSSLNGETKKNKGKAKMRTDFFETISKIPTQLQLTEVDVKSTISSKTDIKKDAVTVLIDTLAEIDAEIEHQGGIKVYQTASLSGQNDKRGSDSSKKLVEWLSEHEKAGVINFKRDFGGEDIKLNALEIGSLSSKNRISTAKWFKNEVTRIDLNSQEPELIIQQDFMQRPIPKQRFRDDAENDEKFDLISLSLVLNFVPSSSERGKMLKRLSYFFKQRDLGQKSSYNSIFPCLFFVLPLPCITNSKYINKDNILKLLTDLGYQLLKYHESTKLVYMLLKYDHTKKKEKVKFAKKELNSLTRKAQRNNFSISI